MPLVVETGQGVAGADAYVSEAAVTSYNTERVGSAGWTAADQATRERAIRNATAYIDNQYGRRWQGQRTNEAQGLAWPRAYVRDRDGYCIASNVVPVPIQHATCEMAIRAIAGELMPAQINTGTIESESVSVGTLSKSVTYAGGKSAEEYPRVDGLLASLLQANNTMERG